jgi:hypothetical protein
LKEISKDKNSSQVKTPKVFQTLGVFALLESEGPKSSRQLLRDEDAQSQAG